MSTTTTPAPGAACDDRCDYRCRIEKGEALEEGREVRGISVEDQPCRCDHHAGCTEHATPGALDHSCFPDGSSVTLWPDRPNPGNGVPRASVAVVDSPRSHLAEDGSRGTYTGQVERMRDRYEVERARLAEAQR